MSYVTIIFQTRFSFPVLALSFLQDKVGEKMLFFQVNKYYNRNNLQHSWEREQYIRLIEGAHFVINWAFL